MTDGKRRIWFTPNRELQEAIDDYVASVKSATGLTIGKAMAVEYFAARGIKSWRRKANTNGEPEAVLNELAEQVNEAEKAEDPFDKFQAQLKRNGDTYP